MNIETISAIHEISEHVRAGHFDRSFIENIIGHHISENGMAKIKDSKKEKLKALYCAIHDAWKYNNTMSAVDFWDQFRDYFVHPGRSKEPLHHAMVAVTGSGGQEAAFPDRLS